VFSLEESKLLPCFSQITGMLNCIPLAGGIEVSKPKANALTVNYSKTAGFRIPKTPEAFWHGKSIDFPVSKNPRDF